jgi:hypothetical protein
MDQDTPVLDDGEGKSYEEAEANTGARVENADD